MNKYRGPFSRYIVDKGDHREKVKILECPHCLYASKHFQKFIRHPKMLHGDSEGVEVPEFSHAKTRKRKSHNKELVEEVEKEVMEVYSSDEEVESDGSGGSRDKLIYKCSLYTFNDRNQILLTRHEREEHIKMTFFRCTRCKYVTNTKACLTKHVEIHTRTIKCDMCDFRSRFKQNVLRHSKNHNGPGAVRCSACNFTTDTQRSLAIHKKKHHIPPVQQAAGLGVGRRWNKVEASDSDTAEEVVQLPRSEPEQSVASDYNLKPAQKSKSANDQEPRSKDYYGSDFIEPDSTVG